LVTFTKPAASAAALKVMLYWSGLPEVALYVRFALVVPEHTLGLAPKVMVGLAITVTVIADELLTHPVALLVTVKVAL
jgi:hypothetical protein